MIVLWFTMGECSCNSPSLVRVVTGGGGGGKCICLLLITETFIWGWEVSVLAVLSCVEKKLKSKIST